MRSWSILPLLLAGAMPLVVHAESPTATNSKPADADSLAKALSNPVAALISVPFQYNYDQIWGEEGYRHSLNVQPVIPVSISEHWNMISRTIVPIIYQNDVVPGTDQFGIGDTVQSLFFSPKEPSASGLIWGVGPVVRLPTGGDGLGTDTWAAGPTGVVLKQEGPWTYGALFNHLVDVGGGNTETNATFVQPFLSRGIGKGRTLGLNLEATYDWETDQATVPVNFSYTKVSKLGSQMISYSAGARAYLDAPQGGPDWGVRFVMTLLYPK